MEIGFIYLEGTILKEVEQVMLNDVLVTQDKGIVTLGQSTYSPQGDGNGVEFLSNFLAGQMNVCLGQNILIDSPMQVDQVNPIFETSQSIVVLSSSEVGSKSIVGQDNNQYVNQMVIPKISSSLARLETIKGNVRDGKDSFEFCHLNKLASQFGNFAFYVHHFSTSRGSSLALDDERDLVRNREPHDKGYFLDSCSTLHSSELLRRVVVDSEGFEDSDDVSFEFSSAEVENRLRSREEGLPLHV
ncbi:unnamed protein product [Ilex paraguariensis]|uniref:Uncharacterized protein n=1 Tax=Ilex paraguariensis TaxID=185542 RepID=A0ABC8T3A8_9AQUA